MATSQVTVPVEERARVSRARLGQWVLGKWRLERLIAIGGMAAVFEASQRSGHSVAIKILHPDLAGLEDMRERFLAEGYAANRVAHPGVVTVREEGTTEDGAVFLVMDLLRGQTLAQRLEDSDEALSLADVLDMTAQLLDVLVQAHARGILHRDIKPENVFLTSDGRVKLLDFGIARVDTRSHTHGSQAGTTLGTPAFMPPEQAWGHWSELDGRGDLWSLGATMFLVLSGHPVRERGSVTEQLLGAMTRPVPSLGQVAALPRSVVALVDRALAFDRDARFPDALSMRLAVRAIQDEQRHPDSRTTLPPVSVEPVALSLRPAPAEGRSQRPSSPTVRPVAATLPPPPLHEAEAPRSGLAAYISLGFAVGMGIVIAARITTRPLPFSAGPAQALSSSMLSSPPKLQPPSAQTTARARTTQPHPAASAALEPARRGARPNVPTAHSGRPKREPQSPDPVGTSPTTTQIPK